MQDRYLAKIRFYRSHMNSFANSTSWELFFPKNNSPSKWNISDCIFLNPLNHPSSCMTYLQMPQYHTTHMLSGHCEMVCKSIPFERQEIPCCRIYVALAMIPSWENGWATVGINLRLALLTHTLYPIKSIFSKYIKGHPFLSNISKSIVKMKRPTFVLLLYFIFLAKHCVSARH